MRRPSGDQVGEASALRLRVSRWGVRPEGSET